MKTELLARLRAHLIKKEILETSCDYVRFGDYDESTQRAMVDDKINRMTNIELLEAIDDVDSPIDDPFH